MAKKEQMPKAAGQSKISPKLIGSGILVVLALGFVAQNRDETKITFYFWDLHLSLWVTLVLMVVVGFLIGYLVRGSREKSKRGS